MRQLKPLLIGVRARFYEFTCKPEGVDGCGGVGDHILTLFIDYEDEIEEIDEENNKIIYDYTVFDGDLADLKVLDENLSILVTPEVPAAGDLVDITIFFENTGRKSCTEFKIRFDQTFGGETSIIEDPRFYAIADAGSGAQFNITWQPEEVGTYQITVFLDSDNDIEEYSDEDNTVSRELTVRPHTPELTINEFLKISVDPTDYWLDDIYTDHEINLTTYILNEDYAVDANSVRVGYYDLPENGNETLIGYVFIDVIENATRNGDEIFGETMPAVVTWSPNTGTSIVGNHTIIVRVDPLNEIEEWVEDDNNFSFRLVVLESKPDINIAGLEVVGDPVRGIPSEIQVSIFNQGSEFVSNFPIDFRIDGDLVEKLEITIGQGSWYNLQLRVLGKFNNQVSQLLVIIQINSMK